MDEESGWSLLFTENEAFKVELLNKALGQVGEREEPKLKRSSSYLSELVQLDCGCCGRVRRAPLLDYLERRFPGRRGEVNKFIIFDCKTSEMLEQGAATRPVCRKGSPLPLSTLSEVLNERFDGGHFLSLMQRHGLSTEEEQKQESRVYSSHLEEPLLGAPQQANRKICCLHRETAIVILAIVAILVVLLIVYFVIQDV